MGRLAIFLFALLLVTCSTNDNNPVLAHRSRTLLENKVLGVWEWATPTSKDRIEFKSDLSFSGTMNGAGYGGFFTLAADSILKLTENITVNGFQTVENMAYKVQSVDGEKLVLISSQQSMIYSKAH
jgi:hypothetical protein